MNNHQEYMERAIKIATYGGRNVAPNPMVGCVLVKNDNIIGEGYHEQFGGPHAEEMAIKNSYISPLDSIAYINLEPCCIESKTSACTKLLYENGIKEVFIAMRDPNPKILGNGIKELESYGIKVNIGLCNQKAKKINRGFSNWIINARPWVIVKIAQSNNGYMGIDNKTKTQISCSESMQDSHKLRSSVDAILIGNNTALIDNPKLTVRNVMGTNPIRVVLDTNRKLPLNINLFRDQAAETWVLCSQDKFSNSRTSFCRYIPVKEEFKTLSIDHVLLTLGREGITTLLVEGGPKVINSLVTNNLINELYIYTSNKKLKNANLKSPLILNDEWAIESNKNIGSDNLIIASRKTKCLQEL